MINCFQLMSPEASYRAISLFYATLKLAHKKLQAAKKSTNDRIKVKL